MIVLNEVIIQNIILLNMFLIAKLLKSQKNNQSGIPIINKKELKTSPA
jgi:hypothetical protein